jgi:hypothetical protein
MQLKFCIFSLYSLRVGLSIVPEITREQILGGGGGGGGGYTPNTPLSVV